MGHLMTAGLDTTSRVLTLHQTLHRANAAEQEGRWGKVLGIAGVRLTSFRAPAGQTTISERSLLQFDHCLSTNSQFRGLIKSEKMFLLEPYE